MPFLGGNKPEPFIKGRPARTVLTAESLNRLRELADRQLRGAGGTEVQEFGDRTTILTPDNLPSAPLPDVSNYAAQFVILHEYNDYLACTPYIGTLSADKSHWIPQVYNASLGTGQPQVVYIAKPYALQRTPWDGQTVTYGNGQTVTYTYISAERRSALINGVADFQTLTPGYAPGLLIFAIPSITGYQDPNGKMILWTDINDGGMFWSPDNPITDCELVSATNLCFEKSVVSGTSVVTGGQVQITVYDRQTCLPVSSWWQEVELCGTGSGSPPPPQNCCPLESIPSRLYAHLYPPCSQWSLYSSWPNPTPLDYNAATGSWEYTLARPGGKQYLSVGCVQQNGIWGWMLSSPIGQIFAPQYCCSPLAVAFETSTSVTSPTFPGLVLVTEGQADENYACNFTAGGCSIPGKLCLTISGGTRLDGTFPLFYTSNTTAWTAALVCRSTASNPCSDGGDGEWFAIYYDSGSSVWRVSYYNAGDLANQVNPPVTFTPTCSPFAASGTFTIGSDPTVYHWSVAQIVGSCAYSSPASSTQCCPGTTLGQGLQAEFAGNGCLNGLRINMCGGGDSWSGQTDVTCNGVRETVSISLGCLSSCTLSPTYYYQVSGNINPATVTCSPFQAVGTYTHQGVDYTVTFTPNGCGWGGGSSGSSQCSTFALSLASYKLSGQTTLAQAVDPDAGTLMVVSIAIRSDLPPTVQAAWIPSVAGGGGPLPLIDNQTLTLNSGGYLYLGVYALPITAPVPLGGQIGIVVSGTTAAATTIELDVIEIWNLPSNTADLWTHTSNAGGAGATTPDPGVTITRGPCEYSHAVVALAGSGAGCETWANGYTSGGQDVLDSQLSLIEGFKIIPTAGTWPDAALTCTTTLGWIAIEVAFT